MLLPLSYKGSFTSKAVFWDIVVHKKKFEIKLITKAQLSSFIKKLLYGKRYLRTILDSLAYLENN